VQKDWDAVGEAITTRLAELDMSPTELAKASGVSPATLREIRNSRTPRRRSAHTLAAISTALRLPTDHLMRVAEGADSPVLLGEDRLTALEEEVARLKERVAELGRPGLRD
jgi:transcriptional regulator with XRE-family HTH domain